METQHKTHLILKVMLLSFFLVGFLSANSIAAESEGSDPNQSSKYLDAVREFADNVLKYGRDTYGPKHTPLFVDGLMVRDPNDPNYGKDGVFNPVEWIAPNGERWVLCNLASQQQFFRTLVALTIITGDPKYKQAAMHATRYAFDNLRSPNGLLYWGHVAAYDASNDLVYSYNSHHTLKLHYPYYELMWKVDSNATREFIEAFWSGHINDWSILDMNRWSFMTINLEEPWDNEYNEAGPTFFKSEYQGGGFYNTATSLVQAGTTLYRLSGQEQPLIWSKRLTKRFLDTRHPNTGITAHIYNNSWLQLGEDMKEHFTDPYTTVFPWQFYEYRYLYFPENVLAHPWISILLVGEMLGEDGNEFTQWALEELTAWGKASYRKQDNSFIPMLTDGTSLEGYVWKDGPGNSTGLNVIKPYPADLSFFWAYSAAYRTTGNEFMWEMLRDIALGNDFGDIGKTSAQMPKLRVDTTCSDVYGLLGFLELYNKTNKSEFLQIARRIGDNIVENQFYKGFFVLSKKHIYTRFDCYEPLALLHLYAAIKSEPNSVPRVWPSMPLFVPPYRFKQEGEYHRIIYALTELPKPPLSLQEAAAIGDVNIVRSLLDKGVGVDSWDDPVKKTALHRAVVSGHKEVVELLLDKGAQVDTKDYYPGGTPLHYAAQRGQKK